MNSMVPDTPHMDEAGLVCFKASIAKARCYLEFGSGGSTVYACNQADVPVIISVDTDPAWVSSVTSSLQRNPSAGVAVLLCDVGEVGPWGVPNSRERVGDFWRYMSQPWEYARSNSLVPDLVLIDGRFRVACFLFSLLNARPGTIILFDDYLNRPEYFVVEKFCKLLDSHGRMARFITSTQYDVSELCAQIARYSVIWD
jgi:hypothetical protein